MTISTMKFKRLLMITGLIVCSAKAVAADSPLITIQHQWAHCNYQVKGSHNKEQCLEQLTRMASLALAKQPQRDDLRIWLAISKSTLAGQKGGFGALSLVKQARKELEQVIKHDGQELGGSAYTTIGSLYYQVPGWPIGFGSDKKAKKYLKKALAINPKGIDSNYFYADFLRDQGEKKQAIQYFLKAYKAPKRPNRPLADKGRRQEIKAKLAKLECTVTNHCFSE